jgi:hypothetical protein
VHTVARSTSSLLLLVASAAAPVSLSGLCPKARGDEIIVCGDREPRLSPYRLPLAVAPDIGLKSSDSVSRERNGLFDYDPGGSGLCSSVGAGGAWGCSFKQFKANVNQRAGARDVRGRVYDALEK